MQKLEPLLNYYVCNKLFSNKAATTEITDAANLVIPANGHTLDIATVILAMGAGKEAARAIDAAIKAKEQ